MTPAELSTTIVSCLSEAVAAGEVALDVPETVTVERPRNRDHGDWATNVALQLAKTAGMPPRALAEVLATRLAAAPGVARVDVAGPGFLNITVDAAAAGELARTVVEAGTAYGTGTSGVGQKVNLEFVSANPTGPIHIGGVRWAAVGDSLARVLQATGAEVAREYYFNDHGAQIDRFARSLLARAKGEPVPEDGYGGSYIDEIAAQVLAAGARRAGAGRPAGGLPARGRRPDVRRDQGASCTTSASTSTCTSTRTTCTPRAPSSARSSGCASRAGCSSRTARSGCARPSSATTATGW